MQSICILTALHFVLQVALYLLSVLSFCQMSESILFFLFSFAFIGVAFLLSYVLKDKNRELARKSAHLVLSFWPFCVVLFPSVPTCLVLAGPFAFFFINILSPYIAPLEHLFGRDRALGLALFPLSLFLITLFYKMGMIESNVLIISSLVMGIADTFSALGGMYFGKHRIFSKSIEGSVCMFISTFLILSSHLGFAFSLLFSFIITIVELFSPKGWDNLTVPVLTTFLLCLV